MASTWILESIISKLWIAGRYTDTGELVMFGCRICSPNNIDQFNHEPKEYIHAFSCPVAESLELPRWPERKPTNIKELAPYLRGLAQVATPGPWIAGEAVTSMLTPTVQVCNGFVAPVQYANIDTRGKEDAEFIAEANPENILLLLSGLDSMYKGLIAALQVIVHKGWWDSDLFDSVFSAFPEGYRDEVTMHEILKRLEDN